MYVAEAVIVEARRSLGSTGSPETDGSSIGSFYADILGSVGVDSTIVRQTPLTVAGFDTLTRIATIPQAMFRKPEPADVLVVDPRIYAPSVFDILSTAGASLPEAVELEAPRRTVPIVNVGDAAVLRADQHGEGGRHYFAGRSLESYFGGPFLERSEVIANPQLIIDAVAAALEHR